MPHIIGTAGHIDHGKTALIRALTGQDTDRLKEEKERGISIDLGFAYMDLANGERVGIVDVPGHERFIRNMLAGAHGIDLVLLVVAADDGVMPQTEEHLDILHLLGVAHGIVAITKADLVDADAARRGAGRNRDPARRNDAGGIAESSPSRRSPAWGWMRCGHAIERSSGRLSTRRARRLLPPARRSRLRHARPRHRGHRHRDRRHRAPGRRRAHLAGRRRGARAHRAGARPRGGGSDVRAARRAEPRRRRTQRRAARPRDLRSRASTASPIASTRGWRSDPRPAGRWRATRSCASTSAPPRSSASSSCSTDATSWRRGSPAFAQLVLREPLHALRGDRFILRNQSAQRTIGGGVVMHPFARRYRRGAVPLLALEALRAASNPADVVRALLHVETDFAVDAGVSGAGGGAVARHGPRRAAQRALDPRPAGCRERRGVHHRREVGSVACGRPRRPRGVSPPEAARAGDGDGIAAQPDRPGSRAEDVSRRARRAGGREGAWRATTACCVCRRIASR